MLGVEVLRTVEGISVGIVGIFCVGEGDGTKDGIAVGVSEIDGNFDGWLLGIGLAVGVVGKEDGVPVGAVGKRDGIIEGSPDGGNEIDRIPNGAMVGAVGKDEGVEVGLVGLSDGAGLEAGLEVGKKEG